MLTSNVTSPPGQARKQICHITGKGTAKAATTKRRIRWTADLHEKFEVAVRDLGGAQVATPKGILDIMKAPEVTIMHVKSHLQKYRLTLTAAAGDEEDSLSESPIQANQTKSRSLSSDVRQLDRLKQDELGHKPQLEAHGGLPLLNDDKDARTRMIETLAQQYVMQEELKQQIMVRFTALKCILVVRGEHQVSMTSIHRDASLRSNSWRQTVAADVHHD
jgi:SHAQKYF class myb-like DNA-binding protein